MRFPSRLGSLGLVVIAVLGCGDAPEAEAPLPRLVRAETFYLEGGGRTRTFSGVARAGIESQLSFKVAGTIEDLRVQIGDQVAAGDLIARLDATDYEIQVADAEAALSRQQAAARSAASTYQRTEALYENNNASLSDLESARANDESARAAVQSAEKALERAQRQLSYCVLRSPIDGAIAQVMVEEGENVGTGAPVVTLTAGARTEVEVSLPEMLIGDVREGQKVIVRFSVDEGAPVNATVTEVGVSAVGGGTTYPVRARLDRPNESIRPGMAAEVDFSFDARSGRDVILVPPAAVAEDVHGRYAFVVAREDETLRLRRVEVSVGDLTAEGLEILGGIEDGATVVTAGVGRLIDGEEVRLWTPTGEGR